MYRDSVPPVSRSSVILSVNLAIYISQGITEYLTGRVLCGTVNVGRLCHGAGYWTLATMTGPPKPTERASSSVPAPLLWPGHKCVPAMKKEKQPQSVSNPEWERIDFIVKELRITVSVLSRACGMKHPATFYQIKAGRYKMSARLAQRIVAAYPKYSMGWLLFGEGGPYAVNKSPVTATAHGGRGKEMFEFKMYVTEDQIPELKKWIASLERKRRSKKTGNKAT